MRRREFITVLGCICALPITARAQQQPDRMRLVTVLMAPAERDPVAQALLTAFRAALAKLGWVESKNLRIEIRWSAANADRASALAKELIGLRPDAILGQTTPVISLLARETRVVPIVFVTVTDPIASGFAASLARPGGNITGFTTNDATMGGKWIELLKEIAPRTVRVALLLSQSTSAPLQFFMPSIQEAASSHSIQVRVASIHAKDEIEGVIAAQARDPGGGLVVMPDPFNNINRAQIIMLTARYGVPAIYFDAKYFAESGGLITYGTDVVEQFRLAAGYIDRILRGETPAELPIQQPTKFELVINLKTAKALGLAVPPTLLAAADDVIE
jgi:putative ABC transport system substrate-binding protein